MNTMVGDLTETAIQRRSELLARQRLEEKIAVLQEFNHLLVDLIDDCILMVDADGRVLSINPNGRRVLQLGSDDVVLKRHWPTLFPEFEGKNALPVPRLRKTFQATSRMRNGEAKFWNITFGSFGG